MSHEEARKLLTPREAAQRWNIAVGNIYRARRRGTIRPAEGEGVPEGLRFEEGELERWLVCRHRLQRQGRPRSKP